MVTPVTPVTPFTPAVPGPLVIPITQVTHVTSITPVNPQEIGDQLKKVACQDETPQKLCFNRESLALEEFQGLQQLSFGELKNDLPSDVH